jgi:nitrate reductase delta subunit
MIMLKTTQTIQDRQQVFELLALAVEYPTPDMRESLPQSNTLLAEYSSRAARQLGRFATFAAGATLGALEELYTATFDLKPVCYPYVGYQLFGDTYKRGEFLAQLNARYREHGFVMGVGELPDHLGIILRYLAVVDDPELVKEGMLPTLVRMSEQLEDNPYRDVIRAIRTALQSK